MTRHADGGSSGGADFDTEIGNQVERIEDLLRQLKGVEAGWKVLEAEREVYTKTLEIEPARKSHVFPVRFSVKFEFSAIAELLVPVDGSTIPEDGVPDHVRVQRAVDDAIQRELGSSLGMLSEALHGFAELRRAQPEVLKAPAHAMANLAHWLWGFDADDMPDFVKSLRKSWPPTSLGSASFYRFYDDLSDRCKRYWEAAAQLATITAAMCATTNRFQKALQGVLDDTEQHLLKTLQNWQEFRGPEMLEELYTKEDPSSTSEIFSLVSFVSGVLSLYPPFAIAAGPTSTITAVISYSTDHDTPVNKMHKVSSSADIAAELFSDLQKIAQEWDLALIELAQGQASNWPISMVKLAERAQSNPNWVAKEVEFG